MAALQEKLKAAQTESATSKGSLEKAKEDLTKAQQELAANQTEQAEILGKITAEKEKAGAGSQETITGLEKQLAASKAAQETQKAELAAAQEQAATAKAESDQAQDALTKSEKEHEKLIREILEQTAHTAPEAQSHVLKEPPAEPIIPDRVIVASDDKILQEFREIREMQRDMVAGSGKIHGIPKGTEGFHQYASENGEVIKSALSPRSPHELLIKFG